ncbi:hypothetical protein [Trichothermofontia sp.]
MQPEIRLGPEAAKMSIEPYTPAHRDRVEAPSRCQRGSLGIMLGMDHAALVICLRVVCPAACVIPLCF